MDRFIGGLLRAGVLLATAFILAGEALYVARHGAARPDHHAFTGEPRALRGVSGIAREVVALNARAVVQLGLLLLVATPVARVAFSAFAFAAQRDRAFVLITLFVLAVLAFSLFGGSA